MSAPSPRPRRALARARALREAAQVEAAAGRHAEAVSRLRRALELSPRPRPRWREQLATLLVSSDRPAAEVDAAYWSAMVAEGAPQRRVLRSWTGVLAQRGLDDEQALDVLLTHQLHDQVPCPIVLDRLLSRDATGRRRKALGEHLDRFRASPAAVACRLVWDAFTTLGPLPAEAGREVLALDPAVVRLYLLLDAVELVPLDDLLGGDQGDGQAQSLDPAALRSCADALRTSDDVPGSDDRDFHTDEFRRTVLDRERFLGFQTRALRGRRLRLPDPFTGRSVVPFDSTGPSGRMLHSFGDRELTVLVTAGGGGVAAGLLLARSRTLLDLGTDLQRFLDPSSIAGLLRHLLLRAVREPDSYLRAVRAARGAPRARRTSIVVGSAENFALHLWTYYSGLERVVAHGLADRVDEIRVAGSEFFGPVGGIFPELGAARLVRDADDRRDPYPFAPEELLVRPGGYVVTRSLRSRVATAMRRLPPVRAGAAEPSGDEEFPVVWVGLRVGSRSWLDQHRRLPEVMEGIWSRWPSAVFLLDGYSYPVGEDHISDQWRPDIERLHHLATQVRAAASRPAQVIDLVGNSLRESVLWAVRSDTYLAPVGTTQHKVGWFCEGRGVTYGPPSLGQVPVRERPGAHEAEGAPIPLYLLGRAVEGGVRRRPADRRRHLENIELDVGEVVEALLGLVEQRNAARHG